MRRATCIDYEIVEEIALAASTTSEHLRILKKPVVGKWTARASATRSIPAPLCPSQRKRLCIARALSVKPKIIVADEPVSALDVSIARQVTDLMLELQRSDGLAFLFISHDIAVVGIELKVSLELFDYDQAATIIAAIFLLVLAVERASTAIRTRVL